MARWSRKGRAAYEAEREALLFIFFLFRLVQGVSGADNYYMRGDGDFSFFRFFRFYLIQLGLPLGAAIGSVSPR